MTKSTFGKDLISFETDNINALACKVLEFVGATKDDINDLFNIKNPKRYQSMVDIAINELELAESLKQILKTMLSRDTELIKRMLEFVNVGREEALISNYSLKTDSRKSGIRIKVGDLPQGKEKTSGKATINFGQKAEEIQTKKLKTMIEYEDADLSLLFILKPIEGKSKELETIIHKFLTIAFSEKSRERTFKTHLSDSKLIVHLKFPFSLKDELTKNENLIGFHKLASIVPLTIDCNITSAIDFLNVLEYHQKDYSTPFAFICKPLVMELSVKPEADWSQISDKLLELFGPNDPLSLKIHLQFLKLLKTENIDLSFNEMKDLTDPFKLLFGNNLCLFFPRVARMKEDSAQSLLLGEMIEILQSEIEVYVNLKEIFAFHMQIKAPGFGVALKTPPPSNSNVYWWK